METFLISACLPVTMGHAPRRRLDMGENSSGGGDKFLFFVVGAGIGAVLALLFAPKSGRETRELIARTANDSRDFLTNKMTEGRQVIDDFSTFLDKSKEAVQRQKEQLSAAFEAGKAAYREEKGIPNE